MASALLKCAATAGRSHLLFTFPFTFLFTFPFTPSAHRWGAIASKGALVRRVVRRWRNGALQACCRSRRATELRTRVNNNER